MAGRLSYDSRLFVVKTHLCHDLVGQPQASCSASAPQLQDGDKNKYLPELLQGVHQDKACEMLCSGVGTKGQKEEAALGRMDRQASGTPLGMNLSM